MPLLIVLVGFLIVCFIGWLLDRRNMRIQKSPEYQAWLQTRSLVTHINPDMLRTLGYDPATDELRRDFDGSYLLVEKQKPPTL